MPTLLVGMWPGNVTALDNSSVLVEAGRIVVKGLDMTDFQQWQLWLGFAGFFLGLIGLTLSGFNSYLQWRSNRTRLRVRSSTYSFPVDIEHRPQNAPEYLTIWVTNNSSFSVRIMEIGLVSRRIRWPWRQLSPLRCWRIEDDKPLWPEEYNTVGPYAARGVMVDPRSQREFRIAPHENTRSDIPWVRAVYVRTGDDRVITSTRCSAIPWLWGIGGSRGVLRRWRNNAKNRSQECRDAFARLKANWQADPSEFADMSKLRFTVSESSSGPHVNQASGPIIEFAINNDGPFSVSVGSSEFGVSVVSVDIAHRVNRDLLLPLRQPLSNVPFKLGPAEPFRFWISKRRLANVLKKNGLTGRVELSVFCGSVDGRNGIQMEQFSFDCDTETMHASP